MRRLIFIALMLAPLCAGAAECKYHATRHLDIDAAGLKALDVDLGGSDLSVETVPGLARVEVRGKACASDADQLEVLKLTQARNGDRAQVGVHGMSWNISLFGHHYAYMDLHVRMPAHLALAVDDGSGDATIDGVASLDWKAGSGDLKGNRIPGKVSIHVGSGDVNLSEIGPLEVASVGSGDVTVNGIGGNAHVGHVGSGDIDLASVRGDVRIGSVGSGDVQLRDVQGGVEADSLGSGDLDVDAAGGDLVVHSSGSGDITHHGVKGRVDVPQDE